MTTICRFFLLSIISGPQSIRSYFCLFQPLRAQAMVFFFLTSVFVPGLTLSLPANISQLTHVADSMYSRLRGFLRACVLDGGTSGAVGDSCVFHRDCSPAAKSQCRQLTRHLNGLTPCSHSSPNNLPPYSRTNPHRDLSEQLWCPECVW